MDSYYSAKVSPSAYTERKQSVMRKWPSAKSGTVYMYKSEERFKGNVYSRFFHVFVAKGIKNKSVPLAIYLHGGNLNGVVALSNYRLDKYASGQQETWKKNTASCKYWYDSRKENGYKDAHGNACKPDEKNTHAPTGFVVVYPTGLVDRGSDTSLPPSPLVKELLLEELITGRMDVRLLQGGV